MSLRGAITKLPRECQTKSLREVINLSKDNNDPTSLKATIKVQPCSNELSNKCKPCNEKPRHSRLCVKRAKCRMREGEPSQIKIETIINLLKKKKSRDKFKKMVLKYVPVSSIFVQMFQALENEVYSQRK